MQKMTHEEVAKRLAGFNIEILDQYTGANCTNKFKCLRCDLRWSARPSRILYGGWVGCSGCSRIEHGKAVRKALSDRGIDLVGELTTAKSRHEFVCRACAYHWRTTVGSVLDLGTGCPACAGCARRTCEDVRAKLDALRIDIVGQFEEFKQAELCLSCRTCGHTWVNRNRKSILRGHGCQNCARNVVGLLTRLPEEEFKERLAKLSIQLVGAYDGMNTLTTFECISCRTRWETVPLKVVYGGGCPSCMAPRYITESELSALSARNIRIVGDFAPKAEDTNTFECLVCQNRWEAPNKRVIIKGTGCQPCHHRNLRLSHDDVTSALAARGLKLLQEFTNTTDLLDIACIDCGHSWKMSVHRAKQYGYCKRCQPDRFGATEEQVRRTIELLTGWKFPKARPSWLKGRSKTAMELDGYNEEHRVAFEYQGQQHYNPIFGEIAFAVTTRNDDRKRKICKRRGVLLIRIPYWVRDVEAFIRTKFAKAGIAVGSA